LLEEARSFIPNPTALPGPSLDTDTADQAWGEDPAPVLITQPAPVSDPVAAEQPPESDKTSEVVANEQPLPRDPYVPSPTSDVSPFRRVILFGLILIGTFVIAWAVYATTQPGSNANASSQGAKIPQLTPTDANTTPQGIGLPPTEIAAEPELLDVHFVTDQPVGTVSVDDQYKGDIVDGVVHLSGIEPGLRVLTMNTPAGEIAMSFEFSHGTMPIPKSLPSRGIANVLFVASADEKSRVECNCAPAGLRVGELAERIAPSGLEIPLLEGEHRAELWVGKNRRDLKIYGGRLPIVTIAVFMTPAINETVSKVGE